MFGHFSTLCNKGLKNENEILNIISHIKKRVSDQKIKSELRKKDMLIREKDFETAIDNLVSCNKLELRGNGTNKLYFITTHRDDTILVPQTHLRISSHRLTIS